jgi:hypothetical protein
VDVTSLHLLCERFLLIEMQMGHHLDAFARVDK